MAIACADYLVARDVEVLLSRSVDRDESLSGKIRQCNEFAPDMAVECHNNAGGGEGFEVYYSIFGGVGKLLAENIETEVKRIGQKSRGIKIRVGSGGRDYFAFIRQTICPAVICEGAFVDNPVDVAKIDTDEKCRRFGEAYAKGVLKTLGIEDTIIDQEEEGGVNNPSDPNGNSDGYLVKVTTDALNIREGAGTNYSVVGVIRDRGVYTIVETETVVGIPWGRLKSGPGWIALNYTSRL